MKNTTSMLIICLITCFSMRVVADTKISGVLQDCKVIPEENIIVDIESIKELCFLKKITKIETKAGFSDFVSITIEGSDKIPKNYFDSGIRGILHFDAKKLTPTVTNIYITFDDNSRIERNIWIDSASAREFLRISNMHDTPSP